MATFRSVSHKRRALLSAALYTVRTNRVDRIIAISAAISGTQTSTHVLTCTVNGSATSQTFQWLRDGVAIAAATAATYTLVVGDIGHHISCAVRYKDSRGFLNMITTAATASIPS